MTGTMKDILTAERDSSTGLHVVRKGNDGLWLNFNPNMRGGTKGGAVQHVRGLTGRSLRLGELIGEWKIEGQQCEVRCIKVLSGYFDIEVKDPSSVRSRLLSAQGKLRGGYGLNGLNVHVHAPLIERLGETAAIDSAREWANQLMLCLPNVRAVIGCERVSRIDYAVDVLVEKGGPDDYGPAIHEQLISRLQHPLVFWDTGWMIGGGKDGNDWSKKDRSGKYGLKRVIVSYDKLKERWDKKGTAGVQECVESLNGPGLIVHRDGRVTEADSNKEVRVWRVEFRFHRTFLCGEGIHDADEAIAALPALIANACQTTRLHQRCTTGNVFPTNPVTRLWNLVTHTVT